jgi:oligopeptidase B
MLGKNRSTEGPIAPARPQEHLLHGHRRIDEYEWLQDPKDPAVLEHLKAENEHAERMMRGSVKLQNKLYKEIRARITENDMSVPVKQGPYTYYIRTKKGKQYAIHCRREGERGKEQIILDENELAKKSEYFSLGDIEVSPDHRLAAYAIDTKGNEDHTLYIKDIQTGEVFAETISSVGDMEWSEDGQYIFYSKEDHPHPPRRVYRHRLGEDQSQDVLIYEEKDPQWYVALGKSRSREYIFIYAANYTMTEARFIPAMEPLAEPKLISERRAKVRYYVEHHGAYFYITTNENAVNHKIMRTPVAEPARKNWKVWLKHDIARSISGLAPFSSFLALSIREHGSEEIYISSPDGDREKVVFPEEGHTVTLWDNIEYESTYIRITYDSFITPRTAFDYDVNTKSFTVRKKQEVPFYHKNNYVSNRIWVKSGPVKVPVVLVYKKNVKKKVPLLLEAYGSYGISNDPHFSVARLSLLERGWVVALAHPRGGGEMGWKWHKDAHLMTKHRTGDDFIAVAKHLVKQGYTTRAKLAITGGSAGGMLMGQVLNREPELFGASVVYVPAADLITSLLDENLGGTRLHYDEIGNPKIKKHYRYILKHSPYENVRATAYPPVLVRASMHDIRTPYWEAAKWVARLRAKKTDSNPLLFKVELEGGHFGKSGRYEWIKQRAFDYAFLLETMKERE